MKEAYGMNLYINDKYIQILKSEGHLPPIQMDLSLSSPEGMNPLKLPAKVFVNHIKPTDLQNIISWIEAKKVPHLQNLYCLGDDYEGLKSFMKSQFRIIKAAGGLVRKRDKFLMIYRLGKWDLPKGKLEKNEKTREAAQREVLEECGVEVEVIDKLCTTWHTYIQEGKRILKKSTWYNMDCVDDTNMEPQYIENIEDIRWMTWEECQKALKNSYRSIQGVFEAWDYTQHRVKG